MANLSHRAAQRYNKRLYEILSPERIEAATQEKPMTDQPIIYWQDDDNFPRLSLTPPPGISTACMLTLGDDQYNLTREQARSLGYALIARAIMAEPLTEQEDGTR